MGPKRNANVAIEPGKVSRPGDGDVELDNDDTARVSPSRGCFTYARIFVRTRANFITDVVVVVCLVVRFRLYGFRGKMPRSRYGGGSAASVQVTVLSCTLKKACSEVDFGR